MTFLTPSVVVVAASLIASGPPAHQQPTTSPPQVTSKTAVVSLIGCVERVAATPAARGATQPTSQNPAYKLIDVHPGTGTAANLKPDSQFLLAVSTTLTTPLDLAKFQNQWVEVTGTIAPVPPVKAGAQPMARPTGETATPPLPTLTTTAVKVVSTECK